ncbi:translation initiation factor IF-2 [Lagierella massiliensis]|uniref:translation initiation factor IF-2 n=1 Tax=Lagierella massiliensis TaxID=1689303 RepID=UPI0006D7D9B6|nr:translation initiation factor IF-2 [Lagierella massiliensis]
MKKIRIYEIAKNLDVPAKTVIQELDKIGIKVKSHMSSVDVDLEDKLRDIFTPDKNKNKLKKGLNIENKKQNQNNKKKNIKKSSHKREEDNDTEVDSKAFKHENRQKNKNHATPINKNQNKRKRKKSKKVEIDEDHFKNLQKTTPRLKNKYKKKNEDENEKSNNSGPIEIPGSITVSDLAEAIDVGLTDLMGKLISYGIMASQNEELSFENAQIISLEFGKEVVQMTEEDLEEDMMEELDFEDKESSLKPRPPVVTVMGHVDHGKTSLLDSIRNTSVTRGEAGGITQHIGASVVNVNNEKIIFLDTPGHEAFTAMRSRGAQVTDLAILVVAADDGVMPQTIEAINHAKAAEVPIIVAINKMDKPEANVERIKQELADNDLMPDDWGGDAICMPVSARTGEGIDELLEMIITVAEMEELKANPNRKAIGTVIEAQLDKGRGPTATVLIQKGTLKTGDIVVSGTTSGRIRAMFDDKGKNIKKVGPSYPAQILGLSDVPEAGDTLYAVKDERTARGYADKAKEVQKEDMIKSSSNINLDDLFNQISSGDIKDLNIIIKTDVRGTIDAVKQSFEKLSNDEVKVNIIHGAVGGVTDSDVNLAAASNALIIGFNVRPSQSAIELANYENVEIRTYRVIYEAIEDLKNAIKGMLAPKLVEEITGRAEIRAVFKVPNVGSVAGIYVTSGKILRNASVRLIRDDIVIHEGNISSLKRFKDDTKELATGYEGGLGIENYNDIKEGDVIESFIMKEVTPK